MQTSTNKPGEWQVEQDKNGGVRRFRMVGNVKEYETMVKIDGVEIPQSELHAFNQRKKAEAKRRAKAEERRRLNASSRLNCPFKDGLSTVCVREKCALYHDGCLFAQTETKARKTAGLQCPMNNHHSKCRTDCALYRSGCTLTALLSKNNNESEASIDEQL